MAVTADVWQEAHDYHRQQAELHARFGHGAGILTGLEVVASDPADTAVYIRPGVALDPLGRTIVVAEPLSYDIGGAAEGPFYLLLTFAESSPRANGHVQEGAPLYISSEYGIEPVTDRGSVAGVELVRMRRSARGAKVRDAADPAAPKTDELDLRFRTEIGGSKKGRAPASLAVVHLGGTGGQHGAGARYLAQALQNAGQPAWVEDEAALGAGLGAHTLIYLVGHNGFQLNADQMNALYTYLQGGGTVFIESCRRDPYAAAAADNSFTELLSSLGVKLESLSAGHSLLTRPNLFAAAPPGFEVDDVPLMRVGEGVVVSNADYGCLWQGERRSGAAGRDAIRSAHEWGGNILALAQARRDAVPAAPTMALEARPSP
jgi:hypothetical protein